MAADWLRRVQAVVGNATGVAALQRVTDALHEFILEEPEELRAMYLLRYVSIDPGAEYRANVAKVNKAHIRALQRWIEEGKADGSGGPTSVERTAPPALRGAPPPSKCAASIPAPPEGGESAVQ